MNPNIFVLILNNCMLKHMGKNNPKYLENKKNIEIIKNTREKFEFFFKNRFDVILNKCFIKSQKIYWIFLKQINNKIIKKSLKYNNEDLMGNILDFKNSKIFKVRVDRIIFNFTYNEFMQIINNSLFNYQEPLSETDELICLEYILIKPLEIKNPYTNVVFDHSVLLNFYHFCMFNYINIPIIYKFFYSCNFNIKHFFLENELLIYKYTVKSFIKNLNNHKKKKILIEAVEVFCNFILKYFRNSILKLICIKYQEKISIMNINLLDNYKKILLDYYLMNYFLHNKQHKVFLQYKLKLILELLNNDCIKFIPNNIETDNFSTQKIVDKITNNMEYIVNEELKTMFISSNLNMLINYNSNNNNDDNNINNNNNNNNNINNNNNNSNDISNINSINLNNINSLYNQDLSNNQEINIIYNFIDISENNIDANIDLILNNANMNQNNQDNNDSDNDYNNEYEDKEDEEYEDKEDEEYEDKEDEEYEEYENKEENIINEK